MSGSVDICVTACQVTFTLSHNNLIGTIMDKKICGPMKPVGWLALFVAIFVANMPGAQSQERFEASRHGAASEQTIIFIPGLGSPGDVWAETVDTLGHSADTHIISVAGFGGVPAAQTAGEGDFIAPLVTELADYIDAHQLEDVTLVGHSLGAQISLQLAVTRPEAITSVLVIDSAPFFARLFNPTVTPEQAAAYGQSMGSQMAVLPREQYLGFTRQGLAVQSMTQEGQARVYGYMEASDQGSVARAMAEVAGGDFRPVLPGVRADVTVLVAWAEPSPMTAADLLAVYAEQYAGLAGATIKIVDGARHFIMFDQSDVFMAELQIVLRAAEQ
jgi:pimeloyl-ACP methyl ester carboxylesterase